jgi:hypothetical protein
VLDRLTNDDISAAIDELVGLLGIKEDMTFHDLALLVSQKDAESCAQQVAARLGLPVSITVSDASEGLGTLGVAERDPDGHRVEGVTAVVTIPPNLPSIISRNLRGFPIPVRVRGDYHAQPYAFVAIFAHELSHVLLAAFLSPHKNSELHTDLVPILLGFRHAVRTGRKATETKTRGNATTTRTTTYGYLTDDQFDFACGYVAGILGRHHSEKKRLLEAVAQVQTKLEKATQGVATFRDYCGYLDAHPRERMKKEHAQRLVQLHNRDYGLERENRIGAVRNSIGAAEAFARTPDHYRTSSAEQLKTCFLAIEGACEELNRVTEETARDVEMLRAYVGLFHRVRGSPHHHPQS